MSSMARIIAEEARLIILRAIAEQGGTLNSELARRSLESYGINKTRAWVEAEMRELEQRGAVSILEAGSVLVARLLKRGEEHLARQVVIDGVKAPSAPEY